MGVLQKSRKVFGLVLIAFLISTTSVQAASRAQKLLILQIIIALASKSFDISESDPNFRLGGGALNAALNPNFGRFANNINNQFQRAVFANNQNLRGLDGGLGFNPTTGGTGFGNSFGQSALFPNLNPNFGTGFSSSLGNNFRGAQPFSNADLLSGRRDPFANQRFAGNPSALAVPVTPLEVNNFGQVSPRPLNAQQQRLFGDTENHAVGNIKDQDRTLSDNSTELCGPKAYEAICGPESVKEREQTLADTQDAIDEAVKKSAQESGGMNRLERILADVGKTDLSPADAQVYSNFLDHVGGDFDLSDLVATQKRAMASAIEKGNFTRDKARAIEAVMTARVVEKPDPSRPEEAKLFIEHCGTDGLQNNAFACADHSHGTPMMLFVCPGRKAAALARAKGNVEMAQADLAGTVLHELTHLFGLAPDSPFNSDYDGVTACYAASKGLSASAFRQTTLAAEYVADAGAAMGLAANIASGQTFGLSAANFTVTTLQRLCGTKGDDEHPDDRTRIELALQELKQDALAREALHCSKPSESDKGCTLGGQK